jgi:uncharacterized membrane protein YphA (DoxX/SURF4 family)
MTNIKKFQADDLLRLFLGLVFVCAGVWRIFNWPQALLELSRLNLNFAWLAVFVIALEIISGVLLILNVKTKEVLLVLIIFIFLALICAFMSAGKNIILESGELFVFNPTPTDAFLHFTYLIILIYLLLNSKKKLF